MVYIYYFIILPLIYIICNIFYFIYKFQFFSWKKFHNKIIFESDFHSQLFRDNYKMFQNAPNPLATFMILHNEDKLWEAFRMAQRYLNSIGSKYKEPDITLIYESLKKVYFGKH